MMLLAGKTKLRPLRLAKLITDHFLLLLPFAFLKFFFWTMDSMSLLFLFYNFLNIILCFVDFGSVCFSRSKFSLCWLRFYIISVVELFWWIGSIYGNILSWMLMFSIDGSRCIYGMALSRFLITPMLLILSLILWISLSLTLIR